MLFSRLLYRYFSHFLYLESKRFPPREFSVNCRLYEGRLTKNTKSHVLRSPETLPDVRKHESNTYTDQWGNSSKLFVLIQKVIWCEPCYYFSVPHQWEWAVWWEANSSSSCNLKKKLSMLTIFNPIILFVNNRAIKIFHQIVIPLNVLPMIATEFCFLMENTLMHMECLQLNWII